MSALQRVVGRIGEINVMWEGRIFRSSYSFRSPLYLPERCHSLKIPPIRSKA